MSLRRAGFLLFASMLVLGFGFNIVAGILQQANAPAIVIMLFGFLGMGSFYAAYGGLVMAISGWAIREKDTWMATGLRLLLWGAGPFLLLQVLIKVLMALGLRDGAILTIVLGFIFVTITVALCGIFVIVADVFRTIDRRNNRF